MIFQITRLKIYLVSDPLMYILVSDLFNKRQLIRVVLGNFAVKCVL